MNWGRFILFIVIFAIVVLLAYNVLKKYVLSKLKVSKWILLGGAIVTLVAQSLVAAKYKNTVIDYAFSFVAIVLFLWFFDMTRIGANMRNSNNNNKTYKTVPYNKDKNKKDVVIKPKAKPNRVKNSKE